MIHQTGNEINDRNPFKANLINQANEDLKDKSEIPPFIMTVDIDQGKSEKLKIYYESNPDELAYDFCKRNNLDYNAMIYLTEEIKNVIANNVEFINKPNQLQECIKEENEEEEIITENNLENNKQKIEYTKESNIYKEDKDSYNEFKYSKNIDFEENEFKEKIVNVDYREKNENDDFEEGNKKFVTESHHFPTNSNRFPTNSNHFITNSNSNQFPSNPNSNQYNSNENGNEKKRMNTDNEKNSSYQLYLEHWKKNIQLDSNSNIIEKEKKNIKNIFNKLYNDAELRRKVIRNKSEKHFKINDDSYITKDLSKKSSKKDLTNPHNDRLYNKSNYGVCKNSENFITETNLKTNENCTFIPKTNLNYDYSSKLKVLIKLFISGKAFLQQKLLRVHVEL